MNLPVLRALNCSVVVDHDLHKIRDRKIQDHRDIDNHDDRWVRHPLLSVWLGPRKVVQ